MFSLWRELQGQAVKIVFWLSFAGVAYTYLGYAVVVWAWAKLQPKPWRAAPITPSISIVMAVHNGIALLKEKIERLSQLDYPDIREILIVSDGSTDGTAEFLAGLRHQRIRPIILDSHGGKAVAVSTGMAAATGEILVFMDLRPEPGAGAIQRLVSNFADDKVGCVAGDYILLRDGDSDGSAGVGRAYWAYEQWLRLRETEIDSPVGVPGCFYAVRRRLAVPFPAGIILDDMFQPLSIIRQGYRSVVDVRARVYDTWPKRVQGEFRRKVRTLAGNFQLLRLAPWILTPHNRVLFQLVSHKLMRLIVPYLLLLLFASSVALAPSSAFYTGAATGQAFMWFLALAAPWTRIPFLNRVASAAHALLVLNAAAVVGLYKFLFTRGPLWKIWSTTKPVDMGLDSKPETVLPS